MKRIKTLHLINSYLPTTQNWIFCFLKNLKGCDIAVGAPVFLECNFYQKDFIYFKFPWKYIDNPRNIFWLRVVNKLWSMTINKFYLHYLKQNATCDIVHSHFAYTGWRYLSLGKKIGVPHVVSFYGVDYEKLPFTQPKWKKRYRQLFKAADIFLCEGPHGAEILKKSGCPPQKIRICRLGIDKDLFRFQHRKKRRKELNLIQIAAFTPKKGHKYTLEAFCLALETCPEMTLTFVGPDRGGIRSDIQSRVKEKGLSGRVTFADTVDYSSLHGFLSDYHVFIHPSCYSFDRDCEGGAPVVFLDAQATGMPVISTTHCDIPDEVIHGETGLLTTEKNSDDLSNSIKIFYNMGQKEYDQFALNAFEHVKKKFCAETNALSVEDIYRQILGY